LKKKSEYTFRLGQLSSAKFSQWTVRKYYSEALRWVDAAVNRGTMRQWDSETPGQLGCGTVRQWVSGIVRKWGSEEMGQRVSETVKQKDTESVVERT
jgi:hypothetical protein